MGDALRMGFAVLMLVFGLSALAGWTTAFRNRLYLAALGLSFIALGSGLLIRSETLRALQVLLWCLAAALFLAGLALAVSEVRRELAAIREQRRGLEREMQEYLTRLQAEHGEEKDQPDSAADRPDAS